MALYETPPPTTVPAPSSTVWDTAANQPWVIQLLGGLFFLAAALQLWPGLAGKYRDGVRAWTDGKRRARADAQSDADTALRGEIETFKHLLEETREDVRALRRYRDHHDDVLTAHAVWDQAMVQAVITLGGTPPPRPPLWPDRPMED